MRHVLMILFLALPGLPFGSAAGARDKVIIGAHLHGDMDVSVHTRFAFEQRLVTLKQAFEFNQEDITLDVLNLIDKLIVDDGGETGITRSALINLYKPDTLLSAVGAGLGEHKNVRTSVYLGPKTPKFSVDTVYVYLLEAKTKPGAQDLTDMTLFYVLAKHASDAGLDAQSVVNPLKALAMSYHAGAKLADMVLADKMWQELNADD